MKVLKWVLLLGGVVLFCSGLFFLFYEQETPINQVIGMMGVGVLTVLASLAIKKRR